MFKKVTREVDVFNVEKIKVGTKIKYISNNERDEYYDYENEKTIYDWGYGEVLTIDEDSVGINYYSELNNYVDVNLETIQKEYRTAFITPDMILNNGYVMEIIGEEQ